MKKMLTSTAVVVGLALLGGGVYLWPRPSDPVRQSAMSSSIAAAKTTRVTTKKSVAKKVVASQASQTNATATSSTDRSSQTSSTATTGSDQQTTASQASRASIRSDASSVAQTTTGQSLTAQQVDNWVWEQVAKQYQGTGATRSDFAFQQSRQDGLVYVDVYENQHAGNDVATGHFRINQQGQLEQLNAIKNTWMVVATTPNQN